MLREEILSFFRSEDMEILKEQDRYEIMIACCSQSDSLEQSIIEAIEDEVIRLNVSEEI